MVLKGKGMGFIQANRDQIDMLGYSLAEFVEDGSLSRLIVKLVERLDLSELYSAYSAQGGEAFDPGMMLSVWLLAYSEGQTSTRRLEELCRRDLHYIYLSANLRPDHCSLSRFRQRHVESLPGLFAQVVRLAQEDGLSPFRRISIDGSKVEANASSRANRTKEAVQEDLRQVREQIKEYLQQCQQQDDCEGLDKLHSKEQALEQALEHQQNRSKDLSPANQKKHTVNLTDPQARNMAGVNGKISKNAYNTQIAVDEDSGMIGHHSVVDDPNDRKQFSQLHQGCEQQLGQDPTRQYTMDSGYHSFQQLSYIDQNSVDAVVAEPRIRSRQASADQDYFHRGAFHYQKDKNCYICPAAKELHLYTTEHKRGRVQFIYRAQACPQCHLRGRCLKNPENLASVRTIVRDSEEHLAEAMLAKSRSPEGLQRMRQRACSVEPVFGNLKFNLGFRRFTLRGLIKVRGEFALMCLAHNLRKWGKATQFRSINPFFCFHNHIELCSASIHSMRNFNRRVSTLCSLALR